ncbi:MAG TPA: DUF4157 domain-containing protein [Allosphingosinicella sp.]|jgi:hypothetical protein
MADHAEPAHKAAPKEAAQARARAEPRTAGPRGHAALLNVRPEVARAAETKRTLAARAAAGPQPMQRASAAPSPNRTGLPDQLKAGVEALSGLSMDDVRVHRNSSEPAKLGALAYAQGSAIHLGPGQERHLPHEAWHVVQQKQGRVKPSVQLKGIAINTDVSLEQEADRMGARANAAAGSADRVAALRTSAPRAAVIAQAITQCAKITYGPLKDDSGTDVKAWIGGDYGTEAGNKATIAPSWWPSASGSVDEQEARAYLAAAVVQGHLLNADLGGPGNDRRNLVPITRSLNSTHSSKVEQEVKTLVNAGLIVDYHVYADFGSTLDPTGLAAVGGIDPPTSAYFVALCGKMPDKIAFDYTAFNLDQTMNTSYPGEVEAKNEGAHLKGTFP